MLRKLYDLNESEGYISHQDSQDINRILASMKIDELPSEQLSNIEDYLTKALNFGAVSIEHVKALVDLLKDIQNKK